MQTTHDNRGFWVLGAVAVIFAIGLFYFMQPRERTTADRLDSAFEDIADGVDDAAKDMDPHRTTGEKIGDAVEELGDDIQDATD